MIDLKDVLHKNLSSENENPERLLTLINSKKVKEPKYSPEQILQRLPTTLAQVKACNTTESLLNHITFNKLWKA